MGQDSNMSTYRRPGSRMHNWRPPMPQSSSSNNQPNNYAYIITYYLNIHTICENLVPNSLYRRVLGVCMKWQYPRFREGCQISCRTKILLLFASKLLINTISIMMKYIYLSLGHLSPILFHFLSADGPPRHKRISHYRKRPTRCKLVLLYFNCIYDSYLIVYSR